MKKQTQARQINKRGKFWLKKKIKKKKKKKRDQLFKPISMIPRLHHFEKKRGGREGAQTS